MKRSLHPHSAAELASLAIGVVALIGSVSSGHAAEVVYQFTGGSMAPAVSGLPTGVTASNFSIGTFTFASLSDNGGSGNSLRISAADVGTSSATALSSGKYLSFSLTIPSNVTLNLTSLALDYTSGGLTGSEFINTRVFSSVDGYDSLVNDTIAFMGRLANGPTSLTPQSISLATPESNTGRGPNVNNGDFDNLTNQTVTFYMPFVQSGSLTATDYVDIDNITLTFTPEDDSDYAVWKAQYPDADLNDPEADNDGDGMSNFQEYAFGLDPTTGASVNPITDTSGLKSDGLFTYTRRASSGLTYSFWMSTDLQEWSGPLTYIDEPGMPVGGVQSVLVELSQLPADSVFIRVKAD